MVANQPKLVSIYFKNGCLTLFSTIYSNGKVPTKLFPGYSRRGLISTHRFVGRYIRLGFVNEF